MSLPVLAYRLRPDPDHAPVMLDHATGFLVRHEERLYLIANWHVVTGRNPVTGKNDGGSSSLPEYLEVSFPLISWNAFGTPDSAAWPARGAT